MPTYGNQQTPAGKAIQPKLSIPGTRVMKCNNSTITPTIKSIDNCPYKGNSVLNANRG